MPIISPSTEEESLQEVVKKGWDAEEVRRILERAKRGRAPEGDDRKMILDGALAEARLAREARERTYKKLHLQQSEEMREEYEKQSKLLEDYHLTRVDVLTHALDGEGSLTRELASNYLMSLREVATLLSSEEPNRRITDVLWDMVQWIGPVANLVVKNKNPEYEIKQILSVIRSKSKEVEEELAGLTEGEEPSPEYNKYYQWIMQESVIWSEIDHVFNPAREDEGTQSQVA